jgi:ethanolamine utilization protein EutN
MLLAMVEGSAITTIRHPSLKGWKMLIVQPLDLAGRPDGDVILAIDMLGAGTGTKVVISNDGRSAQEMVGDERSPLRWTVIGIVD